MRPAVRPGQLPQKQAKPGGATGSAPLQARPPSTAPPTAGKRPLGTTGTQTYVVTCKTKNDELGLATLVGEYVESGSNHNRKVFKRKKRAADDDTVFLYFWDQRDGADFMGWYFGEEVGGSQVWSRCERQDPSPPKTGWRVPWNGNVQPDLLVELKRAAPGPPGQEAEAKARKVETAGAKAVGQAAAGGKPAPASADVVVLDDEPQVGGEADAEVEAEPAEPAAPAAPKAAAEPEAVSEARVSQATDRVVLVEMEATQALESASAMMEGEVTEDSLKIVEELMQSQQAALLEALKKLAADIMAAKRSAPRTLPALNALSMRIRAVQGKVSQEVKQAKEIAGKKRQEAEVLKERAKAEERQMMAEQRDAKTLEESLPEAMEVVTTVEDAVDAVVSAASPLASEMAERMTDTMLAAIRETESCFTKAQDAIRIARVKINQRITAAKQFAPEAKKVALSEYQALQEKLNELQKKVATYARVRKDQEQKMEAKKVMSEVTGKLGLVEVEVEKLVSLLHGKELTEAEIKSAESKIPPVTSMLTGAMRLVEQKMQRAEGMLKGDLLQIQERGKESTQKLDDFRSQLKGQLEQLQAQAVLKQGLEKTQAAEEALAKTEEAETPFLKGLELEGVEAAEAIIKLKEAGRAADASVSAAKSFLKGRISDIKRLPEASRASATEELAQLANRVEAAFQKLAAFKQETATREAAVLLREVNKKLAEAEASVQKTVEVSAPLLPENLEEVEAVKLKEASEKTLEAEKAAAIACAEARKVLVAKQKEAGHMKDNPDYTAELAKLQERLTSAQQELGKQRKVAVQGEKLWKGRFIVQEKDEQMKQVEAGVEKAELLTTPIGDERPSNETVLEMDAALEAVQKTLTDVVKALETAQQAAQGSLKDQMQAILARAKKSQEKIDEMKESTREQRERVQCESLVKEARSKLDAVDAGFQKVSEAEGPYLKGMEILPVEEATKALADADAAIAVVQQATGDARTFISLKTLEIRSFVEAVSKAGLEEMAALVKRNEEALEKLAEFKTETEGRKAIAMQQEAIAKVAEAEEAVKKTVEAAAPLAPDKADGISQEAAQEIMEKLGVAAKEASEKINETREFLLARQRDKKTPVNAAEHAKLSSRIKATEVELIKAKAAASDHEQRLVAKILLQEASGQYDELDSELEKATAAAAPLVVEGGRTFVVASMTKMITEALAEHCHKAGLSREELFKKLGPGAEEGKASQSEFVAFLESVPDLCSRPDLAFSPEQRSAVFEQADTDNDGLLSAQDFANLFRERHVCIHEVALTDGFDIESSKTVEKLEVDDVVEALSEPRPLEQLGIMRLEVQVLKEGAENTKGWATMQGNQGTTYFKPFTAFAAYMKSLNKTLSSALEAAQKVVAFLNAKSLDLRECREGPLADVKTELNKMKPKVNIIRIKLDQLAKKVEEGKREHSKREEFEKRKQEEKKDRKAASLILKAISEQVEKVQIAAKQVEEAASPLTSVAESDVASVATPLTIRSATTAAATGLSTAAAEAKKCLETHESKVPSATKGPWHEARQEMEKLRQQVEGFERTAAGAVERVQEACDTVVALKLGQASAALRKSLQERDISAEALYLELAGEGGEQIHEAKLSTCLEELPGLGLSAEQTKLLLQQCGGAGGIGRRGFLQLIERYAKCTKEVAVTSDFDIKTSTTLRKLDVGELVEVLEGPQTDDKIGVVRVKVRALSDGTTGWASVKGNQGTSYLQDCPRPCYYSKEAFILQDGFSTDGSATIRTVKPGEVIEVVDGPRKEVLGNAVRARVKALSDGATGWFTVTSRSGQSRARQGQSTFTCKSGIALTDGMNIKDCKVLRKLDKGEVLTVLEGPIDDSVAGVSRVKAKARKDDAEGWVTTRGNAGSVYAEETGRTYVLEASTPLQESFSSSSAEVRTLAAGETVERLEGPKDETYEPVRRVRGRVVTDGKDGWFALSAESVAPWSPRYRCVGATALSEAAAAGEGRALRELQPGEALEALEGPREGAAGGALWLKCRAAADGAVGWAALAGEAGEVLLECAGGE